ncbi:MAG: CRISPR-associated CARF protein Csa3 [Nanobdellota archaeon]
MENYIKEVNSEYSGDEMVKKVLIATLYSSEPVILATTRLSPDRLVLIIDEKPDKKQIESLEIIKKSLGKVLDVKTVKTSVFDIVAVAEKCVEIIDMQPDEDFVYVNITAGKKTKALGLLFAAYTRHDRVKKIAYQSDDMDELVYLPRISFKLAKSQKMILEYLANNEANSMKELSEKIDLSTAMLYRAIDELKDMDLVNTEDGIKLTDAGKIARL